MGDPSKLPSKDPSKQPSKLPSMNSSKLPSMNPSKLPSMDPSTLPSMNPSKLPSIDPSKLPNMDPTPTTAAPTTMAPTEVKDPCANLKKKKCKNNCVFLKIQRQCLPKKYNFEHDCSQYEGKTPCLEVKVCKFPHGKCVHR